MKILYRSPFHRATIFKNPRASFCASASLEDAPRVSRRRSVPQYNRVFGQRTTNAPWSVSYFVIMIMAGLPFSSGSINTRIMSTVYRLCAPSFVYGNRERERERERHDRPSEIENYNIILRREKYDEYLSIAGPAAGRAVPIRQSRCIL